ncbi:hypothetical protein MKMG_02221 [Methanogenium sp. MK-MG]|nr:hypothetical protein MKMG_02221 [Methanogenium sp. MK-MG]
MVDNITGRLNFSLYLEDNHGRNFFTKVLTDLRNIDDSNLRYCHFNFTHQHLGKRSGRM